MRLRLRGAKVTPDEQRANDRHRWWVVALFLLLLSLFAWLFTDAGDPLGLPVPRDAMESVVGAVDPLLEKTPLPTLTGAADWIGIEEDDVFDSDGTVDCELLVQVTRRYSSDREILVLFTVIAGAFLLGYFLPLPLKRPSFVISFLVGFWLLFGFRTTLWFLAAHLVIYALFHPKSRQALIAAPLAAGLTAFSLIEELDGEAGLQIAGLVAAGGLVGYLYPLIVVPLLGRFTRTTAVVRILAVQAPIIVGVIGSVAEGLGAEEWEFPLGVLFFLWQWCRLMVYHVDFNDGEVPEDLSLFGYLSVFASPAVIANHRYAPYVGQGYAYLESNFLCRDKNKIILSGLQIWGIALMYMVLGDWIIQRVIGLFDSLLDVKVYPNIARMVRLYANGREMTTPTVLATTFIDQSRIFLLYGAVTHFRVGIWRVLGYQMDPQYNKPWMATNLMALWGRFAFHFREFLVRAFYFPFFFRFFKKQPALRVFAATFFATAIGNFVWGHIPDRVYYSGMRWEGLWALAPKWPYYILLGASISLTQVYLMRKGRGRKPWTRDRRLPLDFICMYLTLQFFALIHVFGRPYAGTRRGFPEPSTLWMHTKLFLKGFGIDLD